MIRADRDILGKTIRWTIFHWKFTKNYRNGTLRLRHLLKKKNHVDHIKIVNHNLLQNVQSLEVSRGEIICNLLDFWSCKNIHSTNFSWWIFTLRQINWTGKKLKSFKIWYESSYLEKCLKPPMTYTRNVNYRLEDSHPSKLEKLLAPAYATR